jgi:hypothetical protein
MSPKALAKVALASLAALALALTALYWQPREATRPQSPLLQSPARDLEPPPLRNERPRYHASVGAAATAPPAHRERPRAAHPLTPEHARLRRENALIGALNDALDLADPIRLRALVKQYRAAEPDDVHRLQAGYELLADCLEYPGAASRAAAEQYYRAERASTLRRFVRRICLE